MKNGKFLLEYSKFLSSIGEEKRLENVLQVIDSGLGLTDSNNDERIPKDPNKLSIYFLKDVTGSMGVVENAIANNYVQVVQSNLKNKYNDIKTKFVTFYTEANEVTEEEFYNSKCTGGTIVSSSLKQIKEEVLSKNNDREVIIILLSDGDNLNADNKNVCDLVASFDEVIKKFVYLEINVYNRFSTLHSAFKGLKCNTKNVNSLKADSSEEAITLAIQFNEMLEGK